MSTREFILFVFGFFIGNISWFVINQVLLSDTKQQIDFRTFNNELEVKPYNKILADEMFSEVKILCLVMTHPENHKMKAIHIKNTWGKRCNKLLFMSSADDPDLNPVVLPITDERDFLWSKTKKSFYYAFRKHFDEADWFLKADDDS